ncbi:MAG: KamA family radical SAM protein, partial [Thermodesulfobacteriota bacterium]|nr:KamA family radical SAM protein [Thermodesulfobacteriota bacterium]
MEKERIQKRLSRILDIAPDLKEILILSDPIEIKRQKIKDFLSDMLMATFDDNPTIPPLEWVLTRDAIRVFRNIVSSRSERLSGYSFLMYIDDLLHKEDLRSVERPSPGFFAELEHLLKGIMGKTEVYPKNIPAFLKNKGTKAARLRSADLSKMARTADRFMDRYQSGLDDEVIRKRSINKTRILNCFGATEFEWDSWKWHTKNIIRDVNALKSLVALTEEEYKAVELAKEYKIPFGITPYYLSLMDNGVDQRMDHAVRAQVIPTLHYVKQIKHHKEQSASSMDFMLERDTSPIEGITRRYPMIVILKPIMTCPQICVYCQRNWEIEDVYSKNAVLSKKKLKNAIQWIASTPEIIEVLITGGDPLLLSDKRIENLLFKLSKIERIERIRIGTRTPATLPQRVTDSLVRSINHFHNPGKREIIIITHFEHPYEITPQAMEAVQRFRRFGMEVYNQLVYTFYNSKKFEAAALRRKLRLIGVTP